jgi:hypothetical protein
MSFVWCQVLQEIIFFSKAIKTVERKLKLYLTSMLYLYGQHNTVPPKN